ncbi:MAG TPA: cytochrome c-type biogenesis CcmF C-terminal domain-containing protein, partial [bacterium]|nr:cytochrome c-type biogenesis CcmF C-terminal domain-containing protein [bacterium]
PLLPWGPPDLRRTGGLLAVPAALGGLAALGAAAAGLRRAGVLLVGALAVFAAAATVVEMGRPWAGRGALRMIAVRLRSGGYVAHLGMLVMLVGITASSAFTTQAEVALRPGEWARLDRYVVRYDAVRAMQRGDLTVTEAALTASDGRREMRLAPRHLYHRRRDATTAEVAIRSSWRDDLYVVLIGLAEDGRATLRIVVSPLVAWLWAGAAMLIAGAAWAALPAAAGRRASAGAPDEAISAVRPEAVP